MNSPPTSVNALVRHDELLPHLGVAASDYLPYAAVCPFCDIGRLLVDYDFADQPNGCWYRCRNCGFRGDSIQLYKQAKSLPGLRQAISGMSDAGLLGAGQDTEAKVDAYVDAYHTPRRIVESLWSLTLTNVHDAVATYTELLTRYKLFAGNNSGYQKWFFSRIGLFTSKNATGLPKKKQFQGFVDSSGFSVQRPRGDTLTMWYENAPGRPCAAQLFGRSGEQCTALLSTDPGVVDAGLAFLGELHHTEDTVIAVNDPLLALHIWTVQALQPSTTRIPVVVYHSTTDSAWAYVRADRVIFWAPEATSDVVNVALRVSNSYIAADAALASHTAHRVYDKIRAGDTAALLDRIGRRARPWAEEVRAQVFRRPTQAAMLIRNLKLTPQCRDELLRATCQSDHQHRVLSDLLKGCAAVSQAELEGHLVEEREDGYFVVKSRRRGQPDYRKVANMRFGRPTFLRFAGNDMTYCSGTVHASGQTTTYRVARSEIKNGAKFYDWLESVMLDGGLGVPQVDRAWRGKLYDAVCAIHPPDVQQVNDVVGYLPAKDAFAFPRFTVRDGSIHPVVENQMNLPCRALTPGLPDLKAGDRRDNLRAVSTLRGESVAFWSVFIVMLHNLLAPWGRWKPVTLGMVVDSIDKDHGSVRAFSRTVQLPYELWMPELSSDGIPNMNAAGGGVPTYLSLKSADRPHIEAWLQATTTSNMLIDVPLKLARSGVLNPNWAFLHCGQDAYSRTTFQGTLSLPAEFLAWHQRQEQKPTGPSLMWVYSRVMAWATSVFPESLNIEQVLKEVPNALRSAAMSGRPYRERFMDMLAGALVDGQVLTSLKGKSPVVLSKLLKELDDAGYAVSAEVAQRELSDADCLTSTDTGYTLELSEKSLRSHGNSRTITEVGLEYPDAAPPDPDHSP